MINQKSVKSVESKKLNKNFGFIDEEYNLANIPGLILNNFGIKSNKKLPLDVIGNDNHQFNKVVLFVIDSFGYNVFEKYYQESTFLTKMYHEGIVSKLTTQFPSTTSSNITTLHSGEPIGQTGISEWFYYEPVIDNIFSPLIYKQAKCQEVLEIEQEKLLPNRNLYSQLKVKSYVFQYQLFNEGPYSHFMNRGSEARSFTNYVEGLKDLSSVLNKPESSYCYFYISEFDDITHKNGPDSVEAISCLFDIFKALDDFFVAIENAKLQDTLFLLTADHGHTTVKKEQAIYLNQVYPEILPYLKRNKAGSIMAPAGSFRDMFLYVEEDYLDWVLEFLRDKLKGKAEVYKVKDLIDKGLFGANISNRFLERIGNLVILAYPDEAIWWYEENFFIVKHQGMHGGLTKKEMEIPFLAYPYKMLK